MRACHGERIDLKLDCANTKRILAPVLADLEGDGSHLCDDTVGLKACRFYVCLNGKRSARGYCVYGDIRTCPGHQGVRVALAARLHDVMKTRLAGQADGAVNRARQINQLTIATINFQRGHTTGNAGHQGAVLAAQ